MARCASRSTRGRSHRGPARSRPPPARLSPPLAARPVAANLGPELSAMPVRIDTMSEEDIADVVSIDGPTRMSEGQLRAEFERPWARMWVAREEAKEGQVVVAFVIAWHVADELHVLNVATREDRRRRGIARHLMDHVVAHARAVRVKHLLLEVRR